LRGGMATKLKYEHYNKNNVTKWLKKCNIKDTNCSKKLKVFKILTFKILHWYNWLWQS
jgi:hypothetical protein